MGNLCHSKGKKTRSDVILVKVPEADEIFYKPKISSNSLICYKPKNKTFWEESLPNPLRFQSGCIFGVLSPTTFICIGGLESGDISMKICLSPKCLTKLSSPPQNLAYGFLHKYRETLYIIGSLTQTSEGRESLSPYLQYSLRSDRWDLMPQPPLLVASPGSYLFESKLFLLGGFLNYPESPVPFESLLIFDIQANSWNTSTLITPVRTGFPNCIVTPTAVIIVGGYDPFEHYLEESQEVFLFTGTEFNKCTRLPDIGQLHFPELGVYVNGEVHLYSEDELLFTYSLVGDSWKYIDLEDKVTGASDMPLMKALNGYGEYVYCYSQKDCELLQYSIPNQAVSTTGPSTFHKFPRYPGLGLLSDGRLIIAGGIDEKIGMLKSCWVLEPQLHQSSNLTDLPREQYGISILQIGRDIYAVSGTDGKVGMCQRYSLDTEMWGVLPQMPYCTFLPGSGYVNGKIYCIGGCADEEGASILYLVQVFSVKTEVWEVMSVEYPFGVLALGVISVSNNKLLCFGGMCKGGYKVANTYFFDGNRFALISELPDDEDPESTCFRDPCVINGVFVYAFGKNGKLYKFDLQENVWAIEYPSPRV